jgi:hypothetical protein
MLFYFYYLNVMKDLIKQKYTYYLSMHKKLLKIIKEIFIFLLIIFILVFYYYICMCTYSFTNDNDQLTTLYITSIEELKPINRNSPNIWYKYLLDDFFNIFTSNGKTINHKILEVKLEVKTLMPLAPESVNKSVILNKVKSDSMKSIILECEYYKNKTSLLERQLLQTKIAYHNLIKDIDEITKEMHYSFKKP